MSPEGAADPQRIQLKINTSYRKQTADYSSLLKPRKVNVPNLVVTLSFKQKPLLL